MSVIEREQVQVQVGVDPAREERARVLEAAALEIEVRGWCQRKLEDDAGRVCAIGAIDKVMPGVWPPVVGLSAARPASASRHTARRDRASGAGRRWGGR